MANMFCHFVQIQVVDDASATSPDIPESGLTKMLKQKGECELQLCLNAHFRNTETQS